LSLPRATLDRLHRQWILLAASGGAYAGGVAGVLATCFGLNAAVCWSLPAAVVLAGFFFRLRSSLHLNHPPTDPAPRPSLGAANILTVVRAALAASLAGFLFPPPTAAAGVGWDWLPGLAYLTAAAMDSADGYVARITDNVTRLGELLDTQVDAFGLLLASLLLVSRAKAPLPYLWVGVGYYALQAAFRLRRSSARFVGRVSPRREARWLAGCQMAFAALALLPVFGPEATRPAAWVMTVAMAASLGLDWSIACGQAPENGAALSAVQPRLGRLLARGLPLALRTATAGGLILTLYASPPDALEAVPTPVRMMAVAGTVLCALGVAARAAAMLLSLLCALWLVPSVPGSSASFTLMAALALMLTGAGYPRVCQPEDRVLLDKRGARTTP
jgi:CDP-diacylglycerol--glycerol-3-phosphate 3-phosphatidyltransferase